MAGCEERYELFLHKLGRELGALGAEGVRTRLICAATVASRCHRPVGNERDEPLFSFLPYVFVTLTKDSDKEDLASEKCHCREL